MENSDGKLIVTGINEGGWKATDIAHIRADFSRDDVSEPLDCELLINTQP
ncbi:MAG: hypothetical protein JKX93_09965 [Rhizobiaceae bacterium]|nr:hypothetical protein [Rhizobiaceae bacterium]MBL4696574.1 hypothetical protein [Rhizobiaceae bacterium]